MHRALTPMAIVRAWIAAALLFGHGIPNTSYAQVPDSATAVSIPDSADKDYSGELPRFPPLSVAEAQESFDVLPGFRLELVASEPLVFDPVAFAFDARHRLFVVEMRDYSEQETERLGSVALLQDSDGDGQMDQRSLFVDGLSWPTAIWPWRDGVLVAEPPLITWYRDTDDDGRSDQSETWFDGFGRGNVQGLVNSLRWGVDGMLHGATSSSGATVQSLADEAEMLELRRRDFAIDPLRKQMLAEAGGGQHGLSFNRWGDKFVTSNSDHLQQIIDLQWWEPEQTAVPLPSMRRSIALDGPQAEVFRASPVEPWRIVRTRLRISGVAPGVVEGGGRAAGYFTGATGTWIFDAEAGFGSGPYDTAIVCDVGSNLVHRKKLSDAGLFWQGERIDSQTELVRSRDTWFRPVQIGDAPDGSLIIADMYREVIEHPKSLPPMIKKHLDLTSGRDRGRIWRLTPEQTSPLSGVRPPAELDSGELVQRLTHSVAWQRRMASQLLVERQDASVREQLADVATSAEPQAQILAMHVAQRLGQFDQNLARALLRSRHPRVLQHALRLIGHAGFAAELVEPLSKLAAQSAGSSPESRAADTRPVAASSRVQLELSILAEQLPQSARRELLASLLVVGREPLVQAVVASAARDRSWQLFDAASDAMPAADRQAWLQLLLPVWARQEAERSQLLEWITDKLLQADSVWFAALSASSADTVARVLNELSTEQRAQLNDIVSQRLQRAVETKAATATDYRLLRLATSDVRQSLAAELLQPQQPEAAQRATLELAAWTDDQGISQLLLERFGSLTPALQGIALRGLAVRTESLQSLAAALESKQVATAQIPLEIRDQLASVRDQRLAERFRTLLGQASADRQAVIQEYASALEQTEPSAGDGREVFARVCAQCHRLGDIGQDVGPPLKQLGDKSPRQLLEIILDPNREIDPKYVSYSLLLQDGRVLTGVIEDESSGQISLKEAGGVRHTILRNEIEQIKNSGLSLMPVGIESSIPPDQMSQLIQFLISSESMSD